MSGTTTIEWTDSTWTPIRARWFDIQSDGGSQERVGWHCEHASEGCRNCYAERLNLRLGTRLPFKPARLKHKTALGDTRGDVTVFVDEKMLAQPQRWRRARDIFVCSMTDLFADFVPDEWIDQVFAVMCEAPWHHYQVLTKRARRMRTYMMTPGREARIRRAAEALAERDVIRLLDDPCTAWPLPHVIMMVSAETQHEADERIPELLATPAARRGLSLEPLLGPVDLTRIPVGGGHGHHEFDQIITANVLKRGASDAPHVHWVIVGGESGPEARPMHPDWARSLRDQCAAAGVPFLFKQWGEWNPGNVQEAIRAAASVRVDSSGAVHPWPPTFEVGEGDWCMHRVGKKAAGRLLDGRTHDATPEAS